MALKITKGKIAAPWRWLMAGTEGVGKTTFGASCPSPLFLACESGTNEIDVSRVTIESLAEAKEAIAELTQDTQGHQTIVIDTADALEAMVIRQVCLDNKWDNIETPGYGKGYVPVQDALRTLIASVERMQRATGVNVLLLSHAHAKRHTPPDTEPYDKYDLKMAEKSSSLLREWCDCVFFAQHEVVVDKVKGESKKRGFSTGERVIRTEETAAWRAKNRYGLPATMKFDAGTFAEIERYRLRDHRAEMERVIASVAPEKAATIREWFDKQSNKAFALATVIERVNNGKAA